MAPNFDVAGPPQFQGSKPPKSCTQVLMPASRHVTCRSFERLLGWNETTNSLFRRQKSTVFPMGWGGEINGGFRLRPAIGHGLPTRSTGLPTENWNLPVSRHTLPFLASGLQLAYPLKQTHQGPSQPCYATEKMLAFRKKVLLTSLISCVSKAKLPNTHYTHWRHNILFFKTWTSVQLLGQWTVVSEYKATQTCSCSSKRQTCLLVPSSANAETQMQRGKLTKFHKTTRREKIHIKQTTSKTYTIKLPIQVESPVQAVCPTGTNLRGRLMRWFRQPVQK